MKYSVQDGFPYYVELVENNDFKQLFSSAKIFELLDTISEEQARFRYAPDKWSIKQVLGHVVDHERIMMYRILRFSRKDTTLLAGYDQNLFVDNARFDELSKEHLFSDYKNVRQASNSLIASLSDAQLELKGFAWKYELTVEEFLKATIGHEIHHVNILKSKYLGM